MGSGALRVVLLYALSACGGAAHDRDGGPVPRDAGGDAASSGDAGCGAVGHGTAEEIAATPRADTNLEQLALTLSDGLTAREADYARVVRDVAAIRTGWPEVARIGYFPEHDGMKVIVQFDEATMARVRAGTYHAWDCLFEHYGLVSTRDFGLIPATDVELKGIYETHLVAAEFELLPGVTNATPNWVGGDGRTICLGTDGGTWHYVFDDAGGDCPAGCTEHDYFHFVVAAGGAATLEGRWDPATGGAEPAWVELCR